MKSERFLIIFLLLAATVVLSFFVPPFIAVLLIPAAAVGVIFSSNPRVLLFGTLLVLSVHPLLKTVVPIGPVKFLDEVVIVSMFGVFAGHIAFHRLSFREAGVFGRIAVAMLAYAALTWVFNRGSLRAAFQCFVSYFAFIPFYILSLRYLKPSDFKPLLVGTMVFLWINLALSIGWLAGINPLPLPSNITGVDRGVGTLGGCNFVAYFCAMFFFFLLSVFNSRGSVKQSVKRWAVLTMAALFILLFLTFTNHAYLFLAGAMIPYAIFTKLWSRRSTVVLGVGVAFVLVAAFSFSEAWQKQLSVENIKRRHKLLERSAKVQLLDDLVVKNFFSSPYVWTIGKGPGNGMGPIGKNNRTPFALKMLLPYYQSGQNYNEQQMSSITGNTTSAVFSLWGDFGVIGTSIFLSFYVWLFFCCLKTLKTIAASPTKRVVAEFLVGAIPFFIIINIAIDIFLIKAFAIWIWMWAAFLNAPEPALTRE